MSNVADPTIISNEQKSKFKNRKLTTPENVYDHNAWDDVEWDDDLVAAAEEKITFNSAEKLPISEQDEYEQKAAGFWDKFYEIHQDGFFKDRHWLFIEFPELRLNNEPCSNISINSTSSREGSSSQIDRSKRFFLEVGCGVGNTVFPILQTNDHDQIFLYCCDFSEVAISLVKSHPDCDPKRCHPFVLDITSSEWEVPFAPETLDCIILIFVLSAIHPSKLQTVVSTLVKYLKPGGKVLFRDYGKYDMVQLRFKPGRCLGDRFYVRSDGTFVYFFTEDEVHKLFSEAGLIQTQMHVDRRLQVNRGKMLKMYRIWIQAVYTKPQNTSLDT